MTENVTIDRAAPGEMARSIATYDGLRLAGTAVVPAVAPWHAVLLLHSEGVDREHGGFFTRLASELAAAGIGSLRLDLPGHGESEGRQEELTLSGLLNVIGAGLHELRALLPDARLTLFASGLTGGVAAGYAARRGSEIDRLILINPLIDYQRQFVDEAPMFADGRLDPEASRTLRDTGRLDYTPSFALGRAMLNEVFWLQPRGVLDAIAAPVLIVHGAGPTPVPVRSSRRAAAALRCAHRLVEIGDTQRREWRAPVIRETIEWILTAPAAPDPPAI
ncbi:alpha/beta hydrolase [Nocardia crassostreae]|uniref:alpha/beta hydrolase n=1 Tax=Nocardia crassostreae TaxID=53428 RepID=UPI000A5766A8|nr:alpha/beta fold hydrolase [Nocardia crassostreae]